MNSIFSSPRRTQIFKPTLYRVLDMRLFACLALLLTLFVGARAAQAQGSAFPLDGKFYQSKVSGSDTTVYRIDRLSAPYGQTALFNSNLTLNAFAINPTDRFGYIIQQNGGAGAQLYRVGQSGVAVLPLSGLPSGQYYNGAFDTAGNMYVAALDSSEMYKITGTSTSTAGTPAQATLITYSPAQTINLGDFAIAPFATSTLYGVSANAAGKNLYSISTSGAVTNLGQLRVQTSAAATTAFGGTIGTAFFDSSGQFYAYDNNANGTDGFYQINTSNGVMTPIAGGATASQSDGASNPFTNVNLSVAKTASDITAISARQFDITFDITVNNSAGSNNADNLQITESLTRAFSTPNPPTNPTISIQTSASNVSGTSLTFNSGFNGTTDTKLLAGIDTLTGGASSTVRFTTRVTYAANADVPTSINNVVYASSSSNSGNAGYTFIFNTPVPPVDNTGGAVSPPANANLRALEGYVFEDINYGGGAGRSRANATGGAVVPNARVELYSVSGTTATYVKSTTTGLDGRYVFDEVTAGNYIVRVVNSSVVSQRTTTGNAGTPAAVQTFRTNNGASDVNRVGGEAPAGTAGTDGGSGTTIDTTSGVLNIGGYAQSIAPVTVGSTNFSNIDFGYNFDTIVNTNDSGAGSLRQFIINSNVLGNSGLSQTGQTSGKEVSIFMIPNGSSSAGLHGVSSALTSGYADIVVSSTALPALVDSSTVIDGTTQTANVADSNAGTLGLTTTAGVDGLAITPVNRPEVQIRDGNGLSIGLQIDGTNDVVRGVAVYGFGNGPNSNSQANIAVTSSSSSTLIEDNVIGTTATSFTDPGGGTRSGGSNIRLGNAQNGTIRHNLIAYSEGKGIGAEDGSADWSISGNQIGNNAIGNAYLDGIDVEKGSKRATIVGNLITDNGGVGVDNYNSPNGTTFTAGNLIQNNTITGNGFGTQNRPEQAGVRVLSSGNTIDRNIIANNAGAGIHVMKDHSANLITKNSIYGNGTGVGSPQQIGIDLQESGGTNINFGDAPYVSSNDDGDVDTGANGVYNFPAFETTNGAVLDSATNQVVVRGWARPGSIVEFFIAGSPAAPSGFGQGKTYIATRTEGNGAQDADATTGAYNQSGIGGQPAVGSDNTNRFEFRLPAGALTLGNVITSTATNPSDNSTSEFSHTIIVANPVVVTKSISGFVYLDANTNATRDGSETGLGSGTVYAKLIPLSGSTPAASATQAVLVDATTGAYSFAATTSGSYRIIIDDNNTLTDTTPALPAGYVGTEAPTGVQDITLPASGVLTDVNFGLFKGSKLSGIVFADTGIGSGGVPNNGIKDGSETPLGSVAVKAVNAAGTTIYSSTVTAADGTYTLYIPSSAVAGTKIVETNLAANLSTGAQVGNTAGTYDRPTDAVSFTPTAGTTYSGVNFGDVPPNSLTIDHTTTSTPGNAVFYAHVFTAGSGGNVTFSISSTQNPTGYNWTQTLYRDTNNNGVIDAGEPVLLPTTVITVAAGEKVGVIVKEQVPLNAPKDARDVITLGANFTYTNASPALTATATNTDTTTVAFVTGLVLTKTTSAATAKPGDSITYTLTYLNTSDQPITNLVINDATPAYTTFVSASAATPPTGLTGPTITTPTVANNNAIKWTFGGALAPNATGTVSFIVTVNN